MHAARKRVRGERQYPACTGPSQLLDWEAQRETLADVHGRWMMRVEVCARRATATTRCRELQTTHPSNRSFSKFATSQDNAAGRLREGQGSTARKNHSKPTTPRPYEYWSPEATFARHVLRSILRESTYLPDPVAAEYVKQHTLSRFRTNAYKAWKNRNLFEEQDYGRRKDARLAISKLQRANEGDRECLLNVLLNAYGRTGKRRHDLMRPLLMVKGRNDVLNATTDLESAAFEGSDTLSNGQDRTEVQETSQHLTPSTPLDITPQLRALLQSQIARKPFETNRRNPRRIEPIIPELNTWLRPMPQNRIKNVRKKQYADLLDRVQVPLPTEDWERLRDLASGKVQLKCSIARRKRGSSSDPGIETDVTIRREDTDLSALEMVARYGKVPRKTFNNKNGHHITPRFMQRLYAEVFRQCPTIHWGNGREEWKVTWGFQALLPFDLTKKYSSSEEELTSKLETSMSDLQIPQTAKVEANG